VINPQTQADGKEFTAPRGAEGVAALRSGNWRVLLVEVFRQENATRQKAGWVTRFGYVNITLNNQRMQAHRLAWLFVYGEDPGEKMIDHINGDPADNRICNLRLAKSVDNARNRRKLEGATSSYKGVSWYKRKRKWVAQIGIDGRSTHLGYFHDELAAHMAYCEAAQKYFGEFANFG
jgi:hypothetical protein